MCALLVLRDVTVLVDDQPGKSIRVQVEQHTAAVIVVLSPVAALVVGVVEAIVGWSVRTRRQTRLATSGIVLSVAAAVMMLMALPWSSSSVCGID